MKTVFVLGAGASRDCGLPLGSELKGLLLRALTKGQPLQQLLAASNGPHMLDAFVDALKHAEFQTIDQFLRARWKTDHIRKIGREALAGLLCQYEKPDRLFNRPESVWYSLLLSHFREKPSRVISREFSFITFNYDRSLEHYFYKALTSGNEDISEVAVKNFLAPDNVLHVHGQLGRLRWQDSELDGVVHDYGQEFGPNDLTVIGQRHILLPHEEFSVNEKITDLLSEGKHVVFLGFGFHEQNNDRIRLDEICRRRDLTAYATVQNLSKDRVGVLEAKNVRTFDQNARAFVQIFLRKSADGTLDSWGVNDPKVLRTVT